MKKRINCNFLILTILTSLISLLTACGDDSEGKDPPPEVENDPGTTSNRVERLKNVSTWMYQIQELHLDGAVEALAVTDYPLLVIEPGDNFKLAEDRYDTPTILSALRKAPNGDDRLILAYIDIGEAEDYRDYWQDDWVAPTETTSGSPDFLITIDPDGWSGNYPVAYWRQEWKGLWLGNNGIVNKLANLGFDGIYLDWVEAYDDGDVRDFAFDDGIEDPDEEMVIFIEELRAAGQAVTTDFLVVAQNAPYLIDYDIENNSNRYANSIDGVAMEDTWFYGEGDAEWEDPLAGDQTGDERQQDDFSTANRLLKYADFQNKGIPVFSIDYCLINENAQTAYTEARSAGLIPLVTRVSLSRVTETPPQDFP